MAEPDASQQHCELVKNFLARQSIILFAGVIFLAYTAIRVRRGLERRDLKTFCADVSKQADQQGLGGVLMVSATPNAHPQSLAYGWRPLLESRASGCPSGGVWRGSA